MFLKSIEVRGFKSFADKTELEFTKGVTAVIGPNGSGKSNISDAVRWVLGEQSVKSLRGAKMQDVIFAGTQFRKPVGLAQVSLILDNSDNKLQIDYSQVKITRRLYRSGESEYLINNTKCRLKDVQELFMDTGIGKEGYSIIGQGKIDAILSGHNEDRRQLLEEAAGIVKYKTRKKEAERRLNNTEENLVRINDLLSTYEERVEPLRIDKEKAEEFIELSSELKTREVNIILATLEKNENSCKENEGLLTQINEELINSKKVLENSRNELTSWTEALEQFETEYASERQKYYSQKNLNEKLNGEINLLEERIKNADQVIEKEEKEIISLNEKFNMITNEKNIQIGDLSELNLTKEKIEENKIYFDKKILELASKIELSGKKIIRITQEVEKVKEELFSKKNTYFIIEKELKDFSDKKLEITQKISNFDMSLKIKEKTKLELINKTEAIDNEIEDWKNNIEENNKRLLCEKKEKVKIEKNIDVLNREFNACEAKKNVLNNLEQQYEGYNKSVQRLMREVHKFIPEYKDKCWVLGEILKTPKNYELAIEIALGGAISNVITENEIIAKRLINTLKNKKLGRATFLPIDIVKGKRVNIVNNIKGMQGYIGIASDLVSYDKKYTNAIEYTLGRTVIADNMDNGLAIGKKGGLGFRIVTLDGEVINPGGSLTGGSIYNKNNSIIGRKREIEELNVQSEELIKKIEALKFSRGSFEKNIEALDENNLNIKDRIHSEELERVKIRTRIKGIEEEKVNLIKEVSQGKESLNVIINEIVSRKDELSSFEEKNSGLTKMLEISERNIEELKNDKTLMEEEKSKADKELTEIRITEAETVQKITNKTSEINRINIELNSINERKHDLEKEVQKSYMDKAISSKKITEDKENVKNIEEYLVKADESFKENEDKKIKIKEYIKKYSEELMSEEKNAELINRNLNKIEINKAKLESERDNVFQRLNEDFDLTLAEAKDFRNEDIDISVATKEIKVLKEKISRLGTVNLGAIEEYKEVKEKFEFMSTQRADLIDSKDELLKLIDEMTDEMRTLFKENFEIMRKNFDVTFKELFKGGSADLILSEGDELQANIEINVQPPGKKLQNISLMSGGEKVLSAIALLFAILKMKPTPFCILDEIEAALDDANVFRYAEFLKKFSENIQFIVITHRKGTMHMSDVIYGVTMEEKGVSKILSMDLNNNAIQV
ncbi:chromosome segregation protein SMC [Oceanirhabdus seepicola]|uniref:Chromosome partition protein Smc n=1 Tax=Oceanirhabdus seepicola TaxID=2828781 RepID=A0A9J6P4L9_9CLOT|nr:chromosome segregation protein SMC [Oceanirhabdus seepicola]MCM1991086.1 chromosome segregation protein SMC [Oceanirhabdus seepicola]